MTREKAIEILVTLQDGKERTYEAIRMAIEALKDRPRGEWEETPSEDPCYYRCSNCGRMTDDEYNYCPNCGSDNRGRRAEWNLVDIELATQR